MWVERWVGQGESQENNVGDTKLAGFRLVGAGMDFDFFSKQNEETLQILSSEVT